MDEPMFLVNSPLLQAGGGGFGSILPIILIFAVFYLFMIRPQQRKQKEQKMRSQNLQKGDKIITIGGIHGIVTDLHEKTVVVKTGRDSHVEFGRNAVSTVVDPRAPQVAAAPARRSFWGRNKTANESGVTASASTSTDADSKDSNPKTAPPKEEEKA